MIFLYIQLDCRKDSTRNATRTLTNARVGNDFNFQIRRNSVNERRRDYDSGEVSSTSLRTDFCVLTEAPNVTIDYTAIE